MEGAPAFVAGVEVDAHAIVAGLAIAAREAREALAALDAIDRDVHAVVVVDDLDARRIRRSRAVVRKLLRERVARRCRRPRRVIQVTVDARRVVDADRRHRREEDGQQHHGCDDPRSPERMALAAAGKRAATSIIA
jgi:hypothetical protein